MLDVDLQFLYWHLEMLDGYPTALFLFFYDMNLNYFVVSEDTTVISCHNMVGTLDLVLMGHLTATYCFYVFCILSFCNDVIVYVF